ncbi:MAG: tetratricopeptide repeat protein [Myxococcota bacterium]
MRQRSGESGVSRLRQQAEAALRRSASRKQVEPMLERLVGMADELSEPWVFAHRHLAELRLEQHPWRAALHLRQVMRVQSKDDVVHALMGLSQALLGNYRAAVGCYRRALQIAPKNPWYHHNMGHLLDVALGETEQALPHLQAAHEMEPEEDEIAASLAHCLARLGRGDEARALAGEAVRMAPRNPDHRALLEWIAGDTASRAQARAKTRGRRQGASGQGRQGDGTARSASEPAQAVLSALERRMREGGFTSRQLAGARALWHDFREGRHVRVHKPEVYAAALEYAIALVHGVDGVTQASVARRYGVGTKSVSTRYGEIRDALSLEPGDPRYAR